MGWSWSPGGLARAAGPAHSTRDARAAKHGQHGRGGQRCGCGAGGWNHGGPLSPKREGALRLRTLGLLGEPLLLEPHRLDTLEVRLQVVGPPREAAAALDAAHEISVDPGVCQCLVWFSLPSRHLPFTSGFGGNARCPGRMPAVRGCAGAHAQAGVRRHPAEGGPGRARCPGRGARGAEEATGAKLRQLRRARMPGLLLQAIPPGRRGLGAWLGGRLNALAPGRSASLTPPRCRGAPARKDDVTLASLRRSTVPDEFLPRPTNG
ncbi:hypothetical protein MYXA107069_06580 [Myxococcus xanthus]|nr:hypothetical protein MyxoNM_04765 [Myxococcus xanthus]SDW48246.1 hypothetical protein SAMN05444383_102353 [Myxococcus xanthus]